MYTLWTSHLKTPEEKDAFLDYIRHSRPLLDRLKDILKDKEFSLSISERSLDTYENPNWAYRQAHQNGYLSCLQRILNLIDLDGARYERNIAGQQRTEDRPE